MFSREPFAASCVNVLLWSIGSDGLFPDYDNCMATALGFLTVKCIRCTTRRGLWTCYPAKFRSELIGRQ